MESKNQWINHVRKTREEHGLSYRDALQKARETYTRRTAQPAIQEEPESEPVEEVVVPKPRGRGRGRKVA